MTLFDPGPRRSLMPPPEFVCPVCHKSSWHPKDRENGYCANCHWWTADSILGKFDPPDPGPEAIGADLFDWLGRTDG